MGGHDVTRPGPPGGPDAAWPAHFSGSNSSGGSVSGTTCSSPPNWVRIERNAAVVVDEIIERLGLTAVAGESADELPTGHRTLVEVARALAVSRA